MVRSFDTPIITNDQSVDRVLAAGLPVLLVFQSASTPGSQPLQAEMEKLAKQEAGQLIVARIDPRDNPQTAGRYRVTQGPALVDFRGGQEVARAERVSAADLAKHAAYLLGKGPKPEAPAPTAPQAATSGTAAPAGPAPAAGASNGQIQTVTDATFDQQVMQSPNPVLVDFWAPWCGPCRMTEPIVQQLARELAGKMRVAKINVDENPQVALRYGVQGIPTMLIVKNGQIVDRWVGALPEQAMRSRIIPKVSG